MKKIDKNIVFWALAIIVAALFWSLDGIFLRPKFYEIPIWVVVFLEHILGFLVLSPFIFLGWQKIKNISKKDRFAIFWICIFGGLVWTFMITKAFFLAFAWTVTFATVIILQKLQPIFALFMARVILKEKLKPQFYVWAGLAISAGYVLAFWSQWLNLSEINWLDNAAFFSILAAFAFWSSTVFGKRVVNHIDFKITAGLRFGITGILALILILSTKDFSAIWSVNWLQWKYLALIVISSGAGALFLYYFGLKKVKASTATILELFWPLSAVVLDYFINGNILNWKQVIASIVLLWAFFMIMKTQKSQKIIFKSKVIHGKWRWKKLGFLTANLEKIDLDISHGIYICDIFIENKKYKWLMHFGFVETFMEWITTEIFIKNFDWNLYGDLLEIHIGWKIRDIRKFDNSVELKNQIEEDVKSII